MSVLSGVMSLEDSLQCIRSIESGKKTLRNLLIKNSIYPMFLIGFSYGLILFFSTSILPVMEMYVSSGTIRWIHGLFLFYSLFLTLIVTGVLIAAFGQRIPGIEAKLASVSFVRQVTTYTFCTLYRQLYTRGLTSLECIEAIDRLHFNPAVSLIAQEIKHSLQSGQSFQQAIEACVRLDPSFLSFVSIGLNTGRIETLLEAYEKKTLDQLHTLVKTVSQSLQLISYAMVGVLVFVFYQIMLAPLNLLDSF